MPGALLLGGFGYHGEPAEKERGNWHSTGARD